MGSTLNKLINCSDYYIYCCLLSSLSFDHWILVTVTRAQPA